MCVLNDPIKKKSILVLQIFGSDLFDKEGVSFEPNLSLPTPSNYVLGANDELLIVCVWPF